MADSSSSSRRNRRGGNGDDEDKKQKREAEDPSSSKETKKVEKKVKSVTISQQNVNEEEEQLESSLAAPSSTQNTAATATSAPTTADSTMSGPPRKKIKQPSSATTRSATTSSRGDGGATVPARLPIQDATISPSLARLPTPGGRGGSTEPSRGQSTPTASYRPSLRSLEIFNSYLTNLLPNRTPDGSSSNNNAPRTRAETARSREGTRRFNPLTRSYYMHDEAESELWYNELADNIVQARQASSSSRPTTQSSTRINEAAPNANLNVPPAEVLHTSSSNNLTVPTGEITAGSRDEPRARSAEGLRPRSERGAIRRKTQSPSPSPSPRVLASDAGNVTNDDDNSS